MVGGEIMQIGIVGQGYVGTALKEGMSQHYNVETFDINPNLRTKNSVKDLIKSVSMTFVCVPTPMKKDGSCDTSIVESVVKDIDEAQQWCLDSMLNHSIQPVEKRTIIIIKSTIPPGTTNRLNKKYKNVQIVFNPEFLTEANFIEDFKNQDRIIIGGPRPASTKVRQLFYKAFPKAHIIKTGSMTAEMVKYMTNTFLTTKVSFANEMKMICDELNIDYDKVVEYSTYDERLGKSHWSVPGPDGKLGFGGSCFPKDINALISLSKDMRLYLHTLQSVWKTNLKVRPEKDWEELKGRAVTDE
jgi:UDPglucose 6-dehydrogenase